MPIQFLVTTRLERVQQIQTPIIMVDGTVPGWQPRQGIDLHFDHHRDGGADIQIDELPLAEFAGHDQLITIGNNVTFTTTQVDADACAAAASIILASEGNYPIPSLDKLRAIAYDCDHLFVPSELSQYAHFASNVVAGLKNNSFTELVNELGLPQNRREWTIEQKEQYASLAIDRGTRWLVSAAMGLTEWPGASQKCREGIERYWKNVESNVQKIINEQRISIYRDCVIFDNKNIGGYVDPRAWIKALDFEHNSDNYYPITLTQNEVIVDGDFKGYSYKIGTIPNHPKQKDWDYTKGIYDRLTEAERAINPNAEGWGGRATVGGSGWNTPSNLTTEQVIDIILGE